MAISECIQKSLLTGNSIKNVKKVDDVGSSNRDSFQQTHNTAKYRVISTLGSGKFGKVKLVEEVHSGKQMALKRIDKTTMDAICMERLRREVHIMRTLSHPNIVKLFDVVETQNSFYLAMEYAGGGDMLRSVGSG